MRQLFVWRRRAWRLGLFALALAVLVLAGSGRASAATLSVCPSGCTYTTIAAALGAAHDGDKIAIGAGTYSGGFMIDKSVSLLGAGASATAISGGGQVVSVAGGQVATISDVTISGGSSSRGAGIYNGGTLTLKRQRRQQQQRR